MVESYRRLTVDEVLADLSNLDSDQLHFVLSMEEVSGRRPPVIDGIAGRLASLGEPPPIRIDIRPALPHRRPVRRGAKLLAALATVALLGGAAIAQPGRKGQALPAAPRGDNAPPGGAAGAPLERLVVADPAGYTLQPDTGTDTPRSALLRAVADDGMPDATSFLTRSGFVRSVKRISQTADQHQLVVSIDQFSGPAGASAYARRWVTNNRSSAQATITGFQVGGIGGAVGLTGATRDNVTATVSFTKAAYFVRVSINWYAATGLETSAQDIARNQFDLL